MRISDWSSDVCSSDLGRQAACARRRRYSRTAAGRQGEPDASRGATLWAVPADGNAGCDARRRMVPNGCCSARRSGKAGPMTSRIDSLPHRRQIIDRRVLADALAALDVADPSALRRAATTHLKQALELGRAEIQRRLIEHPTRGLEAAAAQAFLADQLLRLLYDFVQKRTRSNDMTGKRM